MKKAFNTLIIVLLIIADLINTANSQYTEVEILPYISDFEYKILSNTHENLEAEISKHIKSYTVQVWDNLYKIAKKYNIKISTIKSLNWVEKNLLKPTKEILVSDIDWLIHIVKKNESISDIAKLYNISDDEVLKYNSFLKKWVKIWDILLIHNWIFYEESWINLLTENSYQLERSIDGNTRFIKWNCTWFVSQYKEINWRWDAKDWYHNAEVNNNSVWQIAKKWSIIVLDWKWYNRKYGHVWIVMDIVGNKLIIWDMNYLELNKVTYRQISKYDTAITWYIY